MFLFGIIISKHSMCLYVVLLLPPLACYINKHWNCLACNINNNDIKSIFDNGKCLLQSMERPWRGYFHWAFPFKKESTWDIDNNSCQSNDLWWICAAHIDFILIANWGGREITILKFQKENIAHFMLNKRKWHENIFRHFCCWLMPFWHCLF